jgi:hypothetical protein
MRVISSVSESLDVSDVTLTPALSRRTGRGRTPHTIVGFHPVSRSMSLVSTSDSIASIGRLSGTFG